MGVTTAKFPKGRGDRERERREKENKGERLEILST